jgi:hypothetical protein
MTVQDNVGNTSPVKNFEIAVGPFATIPGQSEVLNAPRLAVAEPLLFPNVVAAVPSFGLDTEITISNTSEDTLGSTAQNGVCQLNYYGTSAIAPQTTASIAAGQQLVFDVLAGGGGVAGAPGFNGYIIANCAFPLARGSARLFQPGIANITEAAQALTLPRNVPASQDFLMPFATNEAGFDTAISIANTSADPFGASGATPTAGTCTLHFYGSSAPGAFTTPAILAGTAYNVALSAIAPGFQGYLMGQCSFGAVSVFSYMAALADQFYASITPEIVSLPRSSVTQPLLYFSVSNQNGNDTGIAIANTSSDPFGALGATAAAGACTLNFYGSNAPVAPFLTSNIAAGTVYTTASSVIAPGFAGYITASCPFAPARGYAYAIGPGFTTLAFVPGNTYSEAAEVVAIPRSAAASSLLFSSVTNQNANDTAITISNTTSDSFGTTPAPGACTINYYGTVTTGSVPTAQTSSNIQAGGQLTFTLSHGNAAQNIAGAPGFRGYIIANCSFPLARGVAAIQGTPGGLVITTAGPNLAGGTVNSVYAQALMARNGVTPYQNWTVASGSLPPGLTLNASTGTIFGTPTTATGSPFNFTVTVQDSAGNTSSAKSFAIAIATSGTAQIIAILNSASNAAPPLAPGSLASVYGTLLSTSTVNECCTPLATTLGGATVTVNGALAGLTYASPTQINFQIPYETAVGNATVVVSSNNTVSNSFNLTIVPAAPGIFAVVNPDGSVNSAGNPDVSGAAASVYFTGAGVATPAVADGAANPSSPLSIPNATTTVTVNGLAAVVTSVTLAPQCCAIPNGDYFVTGNVGIAVAHITVPAGLATGSYPVVITTNGVSSVAGTINVGSPALSISTGANLGTFTTGTQNIALAASGGNFAYTWNLVSGSLPPGLALRTDTPTYFNPVSQQAGLIGVATAENTYNFTLSVTSGDQSVQRAFTMRVTTLNIKDGALSLPSAFVNSPYSYTFSAVGNAAAVTYTMSNTSGPTGFTMSPAGVLSGTPTTSGSFSFTVTVTDGTDTVSRGFRFSVYAINITTPAVLPNGTQNSAYSQQLTATGGAGGYTFTATCCFPTGLTMSASGLISGTITSGPNVWGANVTVTDSNNVSYSKEIWITVIGVPPALPRIYSYLSDAVLGDSYNQSVFACCGGAAPFTWTAIGLPPGMSILNINGDTMCCYSNGSALVWGIPQAAGNYSPQITVTDANGVTTTQTFPFHVSVLDADFAPSGTINVAYSAKLRVLGGTAPYTAVPTAYTNLPDGLTYTPSTFLLAGTPLETSGNFNLTNQYSDSAGNTLWRESFFTINGNGTTTISVSTGSVIGPYAINTSPTFNLSACCDASSSYSWSLAGGSLPPNQTLSAGGALSGTLTTAGTYMFLVKVVDPTNSANNYAFRQITETVTAVPVPTITSANPLPVGNVGTAYNQTLTASGGTGTLTFALLENPFNGFNELPPGLTLAPNGTIAGTPTSTGQYFFNVTVTDVNGLTSTRGYTINVYAAGALPPLAISNGANLGTITTGTQNYALSASGGNGAYTWNLVSGTLPPGLAVRADTPSYFNPVTQQAGLTGVATTEGTYSFTLGVTSGAQNVTKAFTLRVTSLNIQDSALSLPNAFVGATFTHAFIAVGNAAQPIFTITAGLAGTGLTMTPAGVLSGTPPSSGVYNFTVSVTDGVDTVSRGLSVSVLAIKITTPGVTLGVLPNGTQGLAYSQQLTATGGAGGYTFTTNCPTCLPNGLTLSPGGLISGTILSGTGTSFFDVTATDSNQVSASMSVALTVIGVPQPPRVYEYLSDAVLGDNYSGTIYLCCGGAAPFTWTATGLPPGMSITTAAGNLPVVGCCYNTGEGIFWGIPQAAGNYNPVFTVTDANGVTSTQTFPFHVAVLDEDYAPNGTIDVPYAATLRVLGGTGPYTSVPLSDTTLPDGVSFTPATFKFAGTPLEAGGFHLDNEVSDSAGNSLQRASYFTINGNGLTTVSENNGPLLGPYTVNTAPSITLSACCLPSYTWSLISGTLPPGQVLSAGGVLSGTLTTAGIYTFLVEVADPTNAANVAFRQLTETVTPLSITQTLPLYGNVGSLYTATFAATGGTGALTWTLVENCCNGFNEPPPGLTLNATNGTLSGVPTASGQYYFVVMVTDASGNTQTRAESIDIYAAGAVPPLSLSIGSALGPYTLGVVQDSLTTSGGVPPYTYSLTPGAAAVPGMRVQSGQPLPNGYITSNLTGAFLGVVTTPGVYPSSIRVTDSTGTVFDRPIIVTVTGLALLNQNPLPKAIQGSPYSYTFTPYGGSGTYLWASTNLPAGLTINPNTGQITGTPTAAPNAYGITIQLADVAAPTTFINFGYTLTINAFAITNPAVLPQGTVGSLYSQQLTAPACGNNCAWTLFSGSLPTGIMLNSGLLSGTFTGTGGFNSTFTIQAAGSNGAVQKLFALVIPATAITDLYISTTMPLSTSVGTITSVTLNGSGGVAPYTWSLKSGTLPTGFTLNGPGETIGTTFAPGFYYLAGKAMLAGTYNFTIQATDAENNTATQAYTWLITPLAFSYTSLPVNGNPLTYNTPYNQGLLVLGGTGNYTSWTTQSPMYPGLLLNQNTGFVTGAPIATGAASTATTVVDSSGNKVFANITYTAASTVTSAITFGGPSPNTVFYLGENSTYSLNPLGGTAPYTVTALTPLPPGVTLVDGGALDPFDNLYLLNFTPTTPGNYTFTLQVQDSTGLITTRVYSIIVAGFTTTVTSTLPNGSVSVAYSQPIYSFESTGGSPTWAFVSGVMAPGLAISPAGILSGTPTQAGTYNFTLSATDTHGSINFGFTVTISNLAMTSGLILPSATLGMPYTPVTLVATGGTGLTWSSTSLPLGLVISQAGTISGTPETCCGRFTPTITVTDGISPVSRVFTIFIEQPNPTELTNQNTNLGTVTVGQEYYNGLLPSGGVPPYTFALAAGSTLPPGFSLVTGAALAASSVPGATALAGAATTPGQYTFSLIATDSAGSSVTTTFTMNVTPINVDNVDFPAIIVGTPFSYQYAATGGTAPYSFSISPVSLSEDMLPPGLTMSPAGLLSGTPTSTGIFAFILTTQDSANHTYTRTISLTATSPIVPPSLTGLYIDDLNYVSGWVGLGNIEETFTVLGGSSTYNWSVVSGTLPPGLSLASTGNTTAELFAAPSAPGVYTFTVRATDNANPANFADEVIVRNVPAIELINPPDGALSGRYLPLAQIGSNYSFVFAAAGGLPPYTFAVSPFGTLPPGLTLTPAGVLSGTPTQTGAFGIALIVTDTSGNRLVAYSVTLQVTPAGKPAPLLPNGRTNSTVIGSTYNNPSVGVPYAALLDKLVTGGTPPYTWALQAGSVLPPGLAIVPGANAVSSYLSGTATTPGPYTFTLVASDSGTQSLPVSLTQSVSALAITPGSLASGFVGTQYSVTLVPSGGTPPYTLTSVGDMPPGLTLSSTGLLSGTPTYAGDFFIGLQVTDSASPSNTLLDNRYEITINNALGEVPAISIAPKPINIFYTQGSGIASTPISVDSSSGNLSFVAAALGGLTGATLSANNGTTPATINLNYGSVTPGSYSGLFAVQSAQAVNGYDVTPVNLTVLPQPPCTYLLTPSDASVSGAGETGTFAISTSGSCTWTATVSANAPWLTLTGATSGTGSGTIGFSAAANTTNSSQTGTITAGGQTFTVTELAGSGCSFGIDPLTINATAAGGNAVVNVTASSQTCGWTSTAANGLTLSPATGTGNGQVSVTIPVNTVASSATLTSMIAGQTLTVNQSAANCTYALSAQGAAFSATGGSGSVNIATPAGCAYNALNGPGWITLTSGATGTGNGTLTYSVSPNSTTLAQTATLNIGGQAFQITEAGLACTVSLNNLTLGSPFAAVGGTGTIAVTTNGSNCSWTAASNNQWITVSPAGGSGNGTIDVTTSSNASSATARMGSILVSGATVGISQGGTTCSYSLLSTTGMVPAAGGLGSVGVVAPAACTWSAMSNAPWLSILASATGGTGEVQFVAQPNATLAPLVGTLTIASQTYTVTEAPAACSYTLASPSTTIASTGAVAETLSFSTSQQGCDVSTVTPLSYASWLTSVTESGSGASGTITYTALPNPSGSTRSGSIQVGDQVFTVTESGAACAYSFNAYGALFGYLGGSGDLLASPNANDCVPTGIGTDQPGIVTLGPLTGPTLDIFTQPFVVTLFNSVNPAVRIAHITFGGGIFTVKQTSY